MFFSWTFLLEGKIDQKNGYSCLDTL
jgi:hypothetical protein